MFEKLRTKIFPQPEDNPREAQDKRNRLAAGAFVMSAAAIPAAMAMQEEVVDMHQDETAQQTQSMDAAAVAGLEGKGPGGIAVVASPKEGRATMTIPAEAAAKIKNIQFETPKTVDVNLTHPVTNIDLKEKVMEIDLSEKPVEIDPK